MITLLKKEIRLAMHPTNILFLFLSAMVLIPNYPYYVIFFYTSLAIFFTCLDARENQDIAYSLLLPVRKSDVVRARFLFVVLFECLQAVTVVPFILLKQRLPIGQNAVGMEANPAFLGLGLLMLGFFNLMFFHVYYRNPNKVGKAFFAGAVGSGVYMVIAEALAHVAPLFRECLDTTGGEYVFHKSVTLIAGIIGYVLLTYLSYKKSGKVFDKIDL